MATQSISIRLPVSLVERLDAHCSKVGGGRAPFIALAIKEKLDPIELGDAPDLTDAEKKKLLKSAGSLNDILSDRLLQEAQRRKNFLKHLDDAEFARLVAGRLPKEAPGDKDLTKDILSLSKCLEGLEGEADLTAELNKVKGRLFKVERELEMNLKLMRHKDPGRELSDLMESIYRCCVEFVLDLIIRESIPGMMSGGGLSEQGRKEISNRVKSDLSELRLHRSGR